MGVFSKARRFAVGMLRYFPAIRQYARKTYWAKREKWYRKLAAEIETNSRAILFECYMGRSYTCSPRALYELLKADPACQDMEFIWVFREDSIAKNKVLPQLEGCTIVQRGEREYFEACARSKYWIMNARCGEYVIPKDDQVYVQCWHGTPLKRLGYDVEIETSNAMNTTDELASRFGADAKKWTYFVSPSAYGTQTLCSAFGLPEVERPGKVLEIGYPRNDRLVQVCSDRALLGTEQCRIKEQLGLPTDKKLLLYAPTWRDGEFKPGLGYVQDTLIDFDVLSDELSDDWVVLFRPHYYIANSFDFAKYGSFVFNAASVGDINDLYIVADALLTDYSSVFFDYACTRRPLLFYMPDLLEYENEVRGFYFDPATLPGPHCLDSQAVAKAVTELDSYFDVYGDGYLRFQERFCPYEDGHAALRLKEALGL